LAELADVRVMEAADGSFSLSLANGQPLVAGPSAAKIKLTTLASNHQEFSLEFAGTTFPMPNDGWGGQLGGLHEAEYNGLRSTQATVSEIAQGIADLFNNVLTTGFDLDGNAGQALFTYQAGSISQLLVVNDLAPKELAFSSVDPA